MIRRFPILLLGLICLACSGRGLPLDFLTPRAASPTPAAVTLPAATATPSATDATQTPSPPADEVKVLRLWLPPAFDPADQSLADLLFLARLDQFSETHPGWQIETRVKALSGPAGLVESMSAASAAAPGTLPDLIALPRPQLESSAAKGLLRPYDGLTDRINRSDWYEYSRELARVQNNTFGLPIAGDALAVVYRANAVTAAPLSWSQLIGTGLPMAFPVSDSSGLFPLNLYWGAGGPVMDEIGAPTLDYARLTQVLTFTESAERSGIMPNWLGPYENYDQVWQLYQESRASLAVNWVSRYLSEQPANSGIGLLPTPDGSNSALITGWAWALVATDLERQAVAVELAEFLVDPVYLAGWSQLAGYLPVQTFAPGLWPDPLTDAFVAQICTAGHLYPPADVMMVVNPLLAQAQSQVFKLDVPPAEAAQQAVDALP